MSAINEDREPARRVFAAEYNDANYEFRESDEERAPRFVLVPSGLRVNRMFVVGTLTDTEDRGSDSEYWRARIVDPTGTFSVYAGQYQSEAMTKMKNIDPPAYVALSGKVNPIENEDDDGIFTALRPEFLTVVDEETRDKWVAETAEATMERLRQPNDANVDAEKAVEHYGEDRMDGVRNYVEEALEHLDEVSD